MIRQKDLRVILLFHTGLSTWNLSQRHRKWTIADCNMVRNTCLYKFDGDLLMQHNLAKANTVEELSLYRVSTLICKFCNVNFFMDVTQT